MDARGMPSSAARYLDELARELAPLPRVDRREILSDLRLHIDASLGEQAEPDEVGSLIEALGDPEEVALQAFREYEERTGRAAEPRYLTMSRALQIGALALVIAASLAATLLPAGVTDTITNSGQHIIETPTLLQTHSPLILIALALPLVLATAPLIARRRSWRPTSIVATVLLGLFAVIASASLGWFYVPAFVVSVIATSLPARPRI